MRLQLILISYLVGSLLAGDELYLLQASPYRSAKTKLWISSAGGALLMRQRITRDGIAVSSVRYDDEARIVAFTLPAEKPHSLEVIKMDTPEVRHTIPLASDVTGDRLSFWPGLIDLPDRGLFYPFSTMRNDAVIGNFGIDLRSLNPARQLLNPCSVSHYRTPGGATLFDFELTTAYMQFNDEGHPVFSGGWKNCDPLFAFPKAFSDGEVKKLAPRVHASTPKIFVASRGGDTRMDISGLLTTTLWVRLQPTGEWRTVVVPGSYPAVRAFGDRLAIAARSSVGEREPNVNGEFSSSAARDPFQRSEFGYEYPGILVVYDAMDGRQWKIDTGHSDSEILLIRGDQLYYRIHTKLIRAKLEMSGVVKTEQVIDDRSEIAEMHWAFFGPAWSENQSVATAQAKAREAAAKTPPPALEPKIVTEMPPGIYYDIGGGALPKKGAKDLPAVIVRNGLQTWYLKSQRMPGYADYFIGPLDDDDLVERLEEEFRKAEMNMVKRVFPRPK